MRSRIGPGSVARRFCALQQPVSGFYARRAIQISATSTTESPILSGDVLSSTTDAAINSSDAQFKVLGGPYSPLLSVLLSASQQLYTRSGTLVGVSGKAENARSTLSVLPPMLRTILGIPFLYRKISSTTPIRALISTKSPLTSFEVINLNGTVDWMVAQRTALLAWTGHTLSVIPVLNRGAMSLARLGHSEIRGRGLVALVGRGQIYQITLKAGEEYVAHPSNVLAYTITKHPPLPYRLKSQMQIRGFQIPDFGQSSWFSDVKVFRFLTRSETWKAISNFLFYLRTTARRLIWADRLFLQFHGPTIILMSSRAPRISDVLTDSDVNEIADSPAGAVQSAVTLATKPKDEGLDTKKQASDVPTGFHFAQVGKDGKVKFEDAKDVKSSR
ncbi:hypothetical protein B7494_g1800 [Chlorociboria aeruginascens]|nr:hypothetical protein B7494_g1800 [Chlorociboria aeruginascens]